MRPKSIQSSPGPRASGHAGIASVQEDHVITRNREEAAGDSGLSAEVVATHIVTYCYGHQTETPVDAVQDLLSSVLKMAK
jgi:hypothetical protein